jgi:hypothetical protein
MNLIVPHGAPCRALTRVVVSLFVGRPFSLLRKCAAFFVLSATCLSAATYEAESAVLSGSPAPSVAADGVATPPSPPPVNSASGGYNYFNTEDAAAAATFTVTAPVTGLYGLSVRAYVPNGFGEKFTTVLVDGSSLGDVGIPEAAADSPVWASIAVANVSLSAGTHTIVLQRSWGYYYIDSISVDELPAPPVGLKFEAENGVPAGTGIATDLAGFSGTGYVGNFSTSDAKLVLPVNLALTGQYRVYVGYTTLGGDKKTRVLLNGADLGEWSLPDAATWAEAGPFTITAAGGVSVLEFQSDWGWYNIDYVRFEYVEPPVGLDFEAETGALFRATLDTTRAGYSGTGYVTNFVQAPDASVTIPVNVADGGAYQLILRAATPNGTKMARIAINGVNFGEASLDVASDAFIDFTGPKVFLYSGINLVTISADWGYYDVDKISLVPITVPPFVLNRKLVDPAAAPEAVKLYHYLLAQFGKVTLAGQTEEPSTTPNSPFDHVLALTGKLPAIRDQDMIFQSSKGGWDDGTTPRGIAWHRDQNGIIAMQWHWFAPLGPTAFYTTDATFDIEQVLIPGTPENIAALADIDLIAAQLGQYAAARVPILWRPLHEADGGWFWWGAKGPGPAKALYRLMFDRLVHYHGLHNLIWVWNSTNPDWYPGDDVVDVVSTDIYNQPHDYSPGPGTFLDVSQLGGYKKLVTLAENGPIPNPDDMAEYHTVWSWFNTWNGDFIMNDSQNESSHVVSVYQDSRVITLDELPDLRVAPAVTAFVGAHYSGAALGLPAGDYTPEHLITRGAVGGIVKSLRIPRDYRVVLYSDAHCRGRSSTFEHDVSDLAKAGFRGPIGSMRVIRQHKTGKPHGNWPHPGKGGNDHDHDHGRGNQSGNGHSSGHGNQGGNSHGPNGSSHNDHDHGPGLLSLVFSLLTNLWH